MTESRQDPRLVELELKARSDATTAVHELRLLIADEPLNIPAYRTLAKALGQLERDSATGGQLRTTVQAFDHPLMRASDALAAGDLETAEKILRERLIQRPTDVNALILMARLLRDLAYYDACEQLLRLALEFQPQFNGGRLDLASELQRQNRPLEAIAELDRILEREPANRAAQSIKAQALSRGARYNESIALYEKLLQEAPRDATLWSNYGHVLKTVGRSEEGRRAMRTAIEIAPASGSAWWNLSNLKVADFSDEDLRQMEAAVRDPDVSVENRFHLHFALGKALEDAGEFEPAFRHYEAGNALRRQSLDYDPADVTTEVDELCAMFDGQFFREREGWGDPSSEPVFVLGMPRAGSTLVEQILASHSAIEGTMELLNLSAVARDAGRAERNFLELLASFPAEQFAAMGAQYLDETKSFRIEGKPRFIDKMPNNWLMAPLIHLMLPNAKIIDARRHPMACGFSNFKQHFVFGQAFSYDLEWFGRYYGDYVRLMEHMDRMLPGRVHRVIHEELVREPEQEIRSLLDYLELPFEEACLRFHETKRAVKTPSSEQVRRPMNLAGLDHWRNFEQWLGPLRRALGDVVDSYPDAPLFRP
ncbi:MAG TPA: sulfotransferase [Sphingomicrobium sp.]|jgi:tetratricopeptide (TPR) repeat protein